MSRLILPFCIAIAIALGVPLPAQLLSCTVSPNPAPINTAVTFMVSASATVSLSNGCAFTAVHSGSPTGPVVFSPFICPAIFITVGPGATANGGWQGTSTPGDYFVQINGTTPAGVPVGPAFFPFRVFDPAALPVDPVLATTGPVTNGSPVGLTISSPNTPFAPYAVVASLTTDVGLTVSPTQHLATDLDGLFNLSFPVPNPTFFSGFAGSLDGSGGTTAPSMSIPAAPFLQGVPIAFQGVVLSNSFPEGFRLTTPLSRTIN